MSDAIDIAMEALRAASWYDKQDNSGLKYAEKKLRDFRDSLPRWHKRPTGPGWWLTSDCEGSPSANGYDAQLRHIAQIPECEANRDDLWPWMGKRWFGPLPPPPKEMDDA